MVNETELFESSNTKALSIEIKDNLITVNFNFNFNLMFNRQICYSEIRDLWQFTVNIENPIVNLSALFNPCAKIACCSS